MLKAEREITIRRDFPEVHEFVARARQNLHPSLPVQPAIDSLLAGAYFECRNITREYSKSFYLSARLLPTPKKEAIMALYAFCRRSDDIVDNPERYSAIYGQGEQALDKWAKLAHSLTPTEADAVLLAWADTRRKYNIPQQIADDLIAGVRMDLTISRYQTFADLTRYCYHVASTVGLMSMAITGYETDEAIPYAIKLGMALQLTNILRDVGEDARSGRIYLPQEDLAAFGVSEEEILRGVVSERFVKLLDFQIARAHDLYEESWPGVGMLSADSRYAVGAASLIYRGILDKIKANGYDVFTQRAHLSMTEKVGMLPRIWWKVYRSPSTGEPKSTARFE